MKRLFSYHQKQTWHYGVVLFFATALLVFLVRANSGLHLFEFGDETEKFVAAQMINSGQHLYRDIFAHHGPLSYMITHGYTNLISKNNFNYIRIFQIFLTLFSCAALFFSPALRTIVVRFVAAGTYLLLLSSLWVVQGMHMILYQQIGGLLLTVAFLHTFLPLFTGDKPNTYWVLLSGTAVTASCFTAYAFGPSAILLTLAWLLLLSNPAGTKERTSVVLPFIVGVLVGTACIVLWLFLYADLKGFLVYHFYFNQYIYAQYIQFSPEQLLNSFAFILTEQATAHNFALSLFSIWLVTFIALSWQKAHVKRSLAKIAALFLFAASIFLLNPRGGLGFQENGFILASFALFSLGGGFFLQRFEEKKSAIGKASVILVLLVSFLFIDQRSKSLLSSPHKIPRNNWQEYQFSMQPEAEGVYGFIRSLTKREKDFLSLIFNPIYYIKTDRLPASGNYYYLPWQASYYRHPLAGYKIDICADILSNTPAVIWFDDIKVGGFLPVKLYQSCVPATIGSNYIQLRDSQLYIRKNLLADETSVKKDDILKMRLNSSSRQFPALPIRMTPKHQSLHAQLKRIGIRFNVSGQQQHGEGELRLTGIKGAGFRQRFPLSNLANGNYQFFEIDANRYTAGEIIIPPGRGISIWESYDNQGNQFTCMTYEYTDGKRSFTPGCPFF